MNSLLTISLIFSVSLKHDKNSWNTPHSTKLPLIGYHYLDKPRPDGRGGGITTFHRQQTSLTTIQTPSSFGHLTFKLSCPKRLVIANI